MPRGGAVKLNRVGGRVVSARNKSGDPACSQAMSDAKRKGGPGFTSAIQAILARCRAKVRQNRAAAAKQASGRLAPGRGTWQRTDRARALLSKRAARRQAPVRKPATKPASRKAPSKSVRAVPDLRSHVTSLKTAPEQYQAIKAHVAKYSAPPASVKEHGMTQAESMRSIAFEGHTYHYPDNPEGLRVVAHTIHGLARREKLPAELTRHTNRVILSTQRNAKDPHWAKKYQMADFRSLATGGNGDVVAYGGNVLEVGTLAHEHGHNLARAKYGSTKPGEFSHYAKVIATKERPATEYATKSTAEDFAESARLFVENPHHLKTNHPLRHKVIKRLMEDSTYAG